MKRILIRTGAVLGIVLIALVIAGFVGAQQACAHDPRFPCSPRGASDAVRIGDVAKSWAFYGHLRPGQTDTYAFEVESPVRVPWNLLVDERDAGNPARPFAILTAARGAPVARIGFEGFAPFYEPFSRERYLATPDASLSLPAGRYRLVVGMRGGAQAQRYTMAIGAEERFGVLEIPYVFGAIHRIRSQAY